MTNSHTFRVLVLADHFGHSGGRIHGGTTYFVNHYPAMAEVVDLTACFMTPPHPAADRLLNKGVTPLFLGRSKWDFRAFTDVNRLIVEKRINLIHVHSEKSLIIGRILAMRHQIPSVVHIHDAIALKPPLRSVQRWLAKRTSAAVLISSQLREHALREHRFPGERIHVVEYGMDLSPFNDASEASRREVRTELSLPPDAPIIALVGRVNRDKGQLEMIQAMSRIAKSQPNAVLLIVGDGPALAECLASTKELHLLNAVRFAGQRDDVPRILSAVDICVMPSMWQEGFGFAALEATASGRPVVAFRSGGIPNIVLHEETGILVERGDVEALARAVSGLLSDPARMIRYGAAGRLHAKSFSIARHIERILEIYRSALQANLLAPGSGWDKPGDDDPIGMPTAGSTKRQS